MIYSCTIKRNVSSNIQSYVNVENFHIEKNSLKFECIRSFGEKLWSAGKVFDGFSVK